jgi:hypothetical protein
MANPPSDLDNPNGLKGLGVGHPDDGGCGRNAMEGVVMSYSSYTWQVMGEKRFRGRMPLISQISHYSHTECCGLLHSLKWCDSIERLTDRLTDRIGHDLARIFSNVGVSLCALGGLMAE